MPLPPRRPGSRRLLLPLLLLGSLAAGVVRAIPRLDLTPYPKAGPGETRWVIQLPGVLVPSPDDRLSSNPEDWRVQLIVGREMTVDCNGPRLKGRIRSETLKGPGLRVYRVSQVTAGPTTRMACPPERGPRQAFVALGDKPFVLPWNVSQPIVIYAPKDLQVRWRLWKAEKQQQKAMPL